MVASPDRVAGLMLNSIVPPLAFRAGRLHMAGVDEMYLRYPLLFTRVRLELIVALAIAVLTSPGLALSSPYVDGTLSETARARVPATLNGRFAEEDQVDYSPTRAYPSEGSTGNDFRLALADNRGPHLISASQTAEPPAFRFRRMIPTLQQPWYLTTPNDIDGDNDGNLYVVDHFGARVSKFTTEGQYLLSWGAVGEERGQFLFPEYICTDGNGNVYVSDTGNGRIQKFDEDGQFLLEWDQAGDDDGSPFVPSGLDVSPDGLLFVCETAQSRISIFDSEANFVDTWNITSPKEIVIDDDGTTYVSDAALKQVRVLNPDGAIIHNWPSPYEIRGLAIAQLGQVAVSVSEGSVRQVVYVDRFGNYVSGIDVRHTDLRGNETVGILPQPAGLFVDDIGQLFVANLGVEKYSPNNLQLNDWKDFGSRDGFFLLPQSVAVSDDGRIYIGDSINDRVQIFDERGRLIDIWTNETFGISGIFAPYDLDIHGDRIAIQTDGIRICTLDGVLLKQSPDNDGGIEFGANGMLYIATQNELVRLDENLEIVSSSPLPIVEDPAAILGTRYLDRGLEGNFYISAPGLNQVLKVSPDGALLQSVGHEGINPGDFQYPQGIAVDQDGYVYVADAFNNRVQRFTSDLDFVDVVLEGGVGPLQVQFPGQMTFDTDNTMYIVERGSNRVQFLEAFHIPDNARAIIVAAGGPFPGNDLWDTTQFCANFAVRTLEQQGFENDSIYYLSSDLDLDLNANGLTDDVDADATNANLEDAITEWAAGADNLLLYMVDHGGEGTFRMSGDEVLDVEQLATWLDQVDASIGGPITVVYDACQSGSFLDSLEGPDRIIITSSSASESAYFLSTGTISFSNFFWTEIFHGSSVADAFRVASDAIGQTIGFQTPQLSDPDGLAESTFLGNATVIEGLAPVIVDTTPSQNLTGATSLDLFAEIEDEDGIARAWAVVRPPNFEPPSLDNPVRNLPTEELFPTSQDGSRWEGRFNGFTTEGAYQLAFYARDRVGNTSQPRSAIITVGEPRFRRAVLLGGGAGPDFGTESVEESLRLAHQALVGQGYREEDIQFYAPTTFTTGIDGLNVLENVDFALGDWLGDDTQDLLLYVVGDGDTEEISLNEGAVLDAESLATRLSEAQAAISGVLAVVLDTPHAGSFLPVLAGGSLDERIVIASAGAEQTICLAPERSISFSTYFWRRVLNGAHVNDAFTHAALAMDFAANGQRAELDDNGDGLFDTATDGLLAQRYSIGSGILLAGDDPLIGRVSDAQTLDGTSMATIWAEDVTTTGSIDRVLAIVELPASSGVSKLVRCGDRPVEIVELSDSGDRYEAQYDRFFFQGVYDITVVAVDDDGAVSLPQQTAVLQARSQAGAVDADAFEDDDMPGEASNLITDGAVQDHNFHDAGDEDWAALVVDAEQVLTFRTTGLGPESDTLLELYAGDGETLLDSNDDRGPQDPDSELRYAVQEDGLLYVRIVHAGGIFGAGTEYELRSRREAGPSAGGIVGGVVTNEHTGDPVAGITVQLRDEDDGTELESATESNGSLSIPRTPFGHVRAGGCRKRWF